MSIPSKNAFELTPEQIRFFDVFGYLVLPGLFRAEAADISAAFDRVVAAHAHEIADHYHEAHYENRRKIIYRFIEKDPALLPLLADNRIQGIARGLAGDDFNYTGGDGNIFTGDTIWHRDSYGVVKRHRYVKIAFYLEDVGADSGCFRVMPGSHHQQQPFSRSLHEVFPHEQATIGLAADEVPGQIIPTRPGDVIAFDFFLQHATCNSKFPRRMFNLVVTGHFGKYRREQYIDSLVEGFLAMAQGSDATNIAHYKEETLFGPELWNYPDPSVHRALLQPHEMEEEARRRVAQRLAAEGR